VASPIDTPINTINTSAHDALGVEGKFWDGADAIATSKERTATESPAIVEPEDVGGEEKQTTPVAAPESDLRVSVESVAKTREYQSSVPSNDNTDHEEERQDSPITSIDEEPRMLQPESRKGPGKVQKLVVKFDGLARAASEEPETGLRARSRSPLSVGKRGESDDGADFGEFEAGDTEPPIPLELPTAEPVVEGGSGVAGTSAALSPPLDDSRSARPCPIAMFGPLNFGVDLSLVKNLFTKLPEPASDAKADTEVPDHIIGDSFTEISERKTWYRISRMGSSRRHDAGDDENYRRVAWLPSTVHHDTIKIVRRWMEEDSIAGRVALGGGISKTQKNMFGWDSTVEPVALDAIFGKKNSHSRVSSAQSFPTTDRSSFGIDGSAKQPLHSPTHRPSSNAGPAVASFGWSSSSPVSTRQSLNLVTKLEPPPTATVRPNPDIASPQTSAASGPPVLPKPATRTTDPVSQVRPSQEGNILDDDDDEWGEMVSSPITPQPPIATNLALQVAPAAASVPAAPGAQIDALANVTPSARPIPSDPWGAVNLSVSEPAPAKPAFSNQALLGNPKSVEHPAKDPTPAPELGTTSTGPLGPTMSPTPTERPSAQISDPQYQDEAAQRILANLPDLSYMLR
jgi:hypothetical protein